MNVKEVKTSHLSSDTLILDPCVNYFDIYVCRNNNKKQERGEKRLRAVAFFFFNICTVEGTRVHAFAAYYVNFCAPAAPFRLDESEIVE